MAIETYLRKYNRKERYWVVRTALGEAGKDIELSVQFRAQLSELTGVDVPASAWWGVDYHLDWLFAALIEFAGSGGNQKDTRYENPVMSSDAMPPSDRRDRIFSGGIGDIDLIVSFADTIILIEAKGAGAWSNDQMSKKYRRLEAFEPYIRSKFRNWPLNLQVFFILMSPREPKGLKPQALKHFAQGGIRFLKMPIKFDGFQSVQRCNSTGDPNKLGEYWQIIAKPTSDIVE